MKKLSILFLIVSQLINAGGDGSLNTAFGINGTAITTFSGFRQFLTYSQFVQSDGSIVVAGGSQDLTGLTSGAIMRFSSNGVLDTTFNQAGSLPGVYLLPSVSYANIVVFFNALVQPDKKIIGVGLQISNTVGGPNNIVIVRLNTDGTFDTTFNGGTPLILSSIPVFVYFPGSVPLPMTGAALQQDGKILVASNISINNDQYEYLLVLRLNPDGSMDTSFGVNGVVKVQVLYGNNPSNPVLYAVGRSIAVQTDQKIVVAGSSDYENQMDQVILMRLNPDGSLDTTFNDGSAQPGVVIDASATDLDYQQSLVIQPNGSILVGTTIADDAVVVIRKTSTGAADTSFNGTGTSVPFSDGPSYLTNICLQNDGKILCSLGLDTTARKLDVPLTVIRYTATGTPDLTFGSPNGFVTESFNSNYIGTNAPMSILNNGTIVVSASLLESPSAIGMVEFLVPSSSLLSTTVTDPTRSLSGVVQPLSIVAAFVDGQEVCSQGPVNNTWQCTILLSPGTHTAFAVAHYPGGNVNLQSPTITVEQTGLGPLSLAIINKYCPGGIL